MIKHYQTLDGKLNQIADQPLIPNSSNPGLENASRRHVQPWVTQTKTTLNNTNSMLTEPLVV